MRDNISTGMVVTAIFVLTLVASSARASAQTETILHSFNVANGDGDTPISGVVFDEQGNIYGTNSSGGVAGSQLGVVFELSPAAGGGWTETVLHSFSGGADGEFPEAGLAIDAAGNLYGTTNGSGGTGISDGGTVFELSPIAGGGWNYAVLYSFITTGTDAQFPQGNLILDAAGNLYGTAAVGGVYNGGAMFELYRNPSGGWAEKLLYSFAANGTDGQYPRGALTFDAAGNLYGATIRGGTFNQGTVFELTPKPRGIWAEKVLHNFNHNGQDGYVPWGNLTFDAAGNLYGTTSLGGSHQCNCGTVFEMKPTASGHWIETLVHSFFNFDGWSPIGGVTFDVGGNLYGTTYQGGTYGLGTAFRLQPVGNGVWTEIVLHNFGSGADGQQPFAPPVFGPGGNLYGTTLFGGGAGDVGSVYELTP